MMALVVGEAVGLGVFFGLLVLIGLAGWALNGLSELGAARGWNL